MGCLSTALPWCPSHEGILPSLLVIKLQLPFVCVMSAWLHSIACWDKYPGYSLQLLLWDTTELAHRDLQTETWVTNANRETLTSRHVWYHSVNWFWRNDILRVETQTLPTCRGWRMILLQRGLYQMYTSDSTSTFVSEYDLLWTEIANCLCRNW